MDVEDAAVVGLGAGWFAMVGGDEVLEGVDLPHLRLAQLEVEKARVFKDVLLRLGPGDHRNAALQRPAQEHLEKAWVKRASAGVSCEVYGAGGGERASERAWGCWRAGRVPGPLEGKKKRHESHSKTRVTWCGVFPGWLRAMDWTVVSRGASRPLKGQPLSVE